MNLKHYDVGEENQLKFAKQAFKVIKSFSEQNQKTENLDTLLEFFVKRIEKLFVSKNKEKDISEFLSLMGFGKLSTELELYNYMFETNID